MSVIMANYCGAPYLAAAIESVLAQSHDRLELIVVDDASTDESAAILGRMEPMDPRLHVILKTANEGAAAARNAALDAAHGEWIAIVDADDLMHPERIATMLAAADRRRADMIADDLVPFGTAEASARTLLQALGIDEPVEVDAAALLRSDTGPRGVGSLGYLKPMIARARIGAHRYDTRLSIGEDFEFYLRLLLDGPPMHVLPLPYYLYRRHAASLSHRLSQGALAPIMDSNDEVARGTADRPAARAAARRGRGLRHAMRYERLVAAMKARRVGASARLLARDPVLFARLAESVRDRRRRARSGGAAEQSDARLVVLGTAEALATFEAPPGAIPLETGPARDRDLACRLNRWAGQGPLDLIVLGAEGVHAAGLVATCRSIRKVDVAGAEAA